MLVLPGSILSIEAFSAVGHFLPFMAGEDSEWLSRVKFLNLSIYPRDSQSVVFYKINNERGFFYFVLFSQFMFLCEQMPGLVEEKSRIRFFI